MSAQQAADRIENAATKYDFHPAYGEYAIGSTKALKCAFRAAKKAEKWDEKFASEVYSLLFGDEA
jgi:hypothetical protein